MKILIACESSGIVRDAFLSSGHDAISCDIIPSSSPGPHIIGDVTPLLSLDQWDMIIAHPPCTYLSRARSIINAKDKELCIKRAYALAFFMAIYHSPCPRIVIENPPGCVPRLFRPYDQLVQPWMFGDPYKKEICLWLKGVPLLLPTELSPVRKSVSNHVNSRMSQDQKMHIKSRFFVKTAAAMAAQWSNI